MKNYCLNCDSASIGMAGAWRETCKDCRFTPKVVDDQHVDAQHKAIGARIAVVRKAKCVTQKDLARATGVSRASIASWERGYWNISLNVLLAVAAALEVPASELLDGAS